MELGCGGTVSTEVEELAAELIRLRHSIDQLELKFSAKAAAFAATNAYDAWGFVTPIDWIRINCHMTGPAAADRVAVGEQLAKMPQSAAAMKAGEIGFSHLTVMSRTAAALSQSATAGPFDESPLLAQARENTVGKFHHICLHARHAADPKGVASEQAELVENRRLTISRWEDGSFLLNGMLDPVGGAALRSALEPLARPAGAGDDRCREKRLADALVDLTMHALDSGKIPQLGGQRTHLQVTTSLETLLGLDGAPAAELEYSLPISAKTVERLACDCTVTRVLLGSDSTVIDVGRAKRLATGSQRKALKVRDGDHCIWTGCDRPASWTSVHHLTHWIRGGSSDLPNLALLCYRHHWMVHEGNWQIVRTDDGRILTIPPTTAFGRLPRGPDQTASTL
jgi:uncharacterized protein DUF222/HNH endonuclease